MILNVWVSCFGIVTAQKNTNSNEACDSLTKKQFFVMARGFKKEIDRHEELSIEKTKKVIRVYNTMFLDSISNDSSDTVFVKNFQREIDRYSWRIWFMKFSNSISKFGALYLKKLNLSVLDLPDIIR